MVIISEPALDRVFSALADPTRRHMLQQLTKGAKSVGALAAAYDMSQPAVSKHLKVLEQAGLIRKTRSGRQNLIIADPGPAETAQAWIARYSRYWRAQFEAVDAYLKANEEGER